MERGVMENNELREETSSEVSRLLLQNQQKVRELEHRMACLEKSVQKALSIMMPKVEALLSRHQDEPHNSAPVQEDSSDRASDHINDAASSDPTRASRHSLTAILAPVAMLSDRDNPTTSVSNEDCSEHVNDVLTTSESTDDCSEHLDDVSTNPYSEPRATSDSDPKDRCFRSLVDPVRERESSSTTLHEAVDRRDAEALQRLLAKGASISALDANGDSALHLAARVGHLQVVEVLLAAGAEAGQRGRLLRSPLHCAAARGYYGVVERLLAAGARADARDVDGATAARLAEDGGHLEAVALLREKEEAQLHADKVKNPQQMLRAALRLLETRPSTSSSSSSPSSSSARDDEPALVLAARGGHGEIVSALLRAGGGANARTLERAVEAASSASAVWVLADAALAVVQGRAGEVALRNAAKDGRQDALAALLEARVAPDARNGDGNAALHIAADRGHVRCVETLLDAGAAVDAPGDGGMTALHRAAQMGRAECAAALLRRGARPDARNAFGETPVHWAAHKGYSRTVRVLLAAGASAKERADYGKTPVDLARTDEIRQMLLLAAAVERPAQLGCAEGEDTR